MTTINISLPQKLREDIQLLIDHGLYASVSDLIRDGIRTIVAENKDTLKQNKQDGHILQKGVSNPELLQTLNSIRGSWFTEKDLEDYQNIREELKQREYLD